MPTLTFPLSRIEGHAQVVIEVQEGKVISAHFKAMEFRGFEYLLKGIPAEQMPVIVPRICGVCSTAHHVAAVKALEDAYKIKPPPLAVKIRNLLLLGQLIQNQATSLFIFTMPDRLGVSSIFQLAKDKGQINLRSDIAHRALKVRKAGTNLISLAGGQFIHPVKAVVGGVISGISAKAADEMGAELKKIVPIACELFDYYWKMTVKLRDRIGTWGDDSPAHYISSITHNKPNFCSENLCIMASDGSPCVTFSPRDFRKYLQFEETDYSYADRTHYNGEIMRANSLARINIAKSMGTLRADEYLHRFRETFGHPAHAILLFDLCRGIELIYALERAMEILKDPLDNYQDTTVTYTPQNGDGYGLVEAPRGPLIHHYHIEKGLITQAEFIIPTVHNVLAIERALLFAAERYITPEQVNLELERAVGRVVRAFDPCIACATH